MTDNFPTSRPVLKLGVAAANLGVSLSALFAQHEIPEALTVTQLVELSHEVVDGCIVAATSSATRLFGYNDPSELVGRYTSELHHPDDALVTRHYALARLHGDWSPRPYPMRILRGRNQEPVPVIKHVRQVMVSGALTWITVHTPFDFSIPFAMPVTQSMIDRSGSSEERFCLGQMHTAYMNQILRQDGHETIPNLNMLLASPDEVLSILPEQKARRNYATLEFNIVDHLEDVMNVLVESQTKRPHHVCLKCLWPWYGAPGSEKRPGKCPRCQDKYWDHPRRQPRSDSSDVSSENLD